MVDHLPTPVVDGDTAGMRAFVRMMAGTAGVKDMLLSDQLRIDGSKLDLVRFLSLIDKAPGNFPIVTR